MIVNIDFAQIQALYNAMTGLADFSADMLCENNTVPETRDYIADLRFADRWIVRLERHIEDQSDEVAIVVKDGEQARFYKAIGMLVGIVRDDISTDEASIDTALALANVAGKMGITV